MCDSNMADLGQSAKWGKRDTICKVTGRPHKTIHEGGTVEVTMNDVMAATCTACGLSGMCTE